MPPCSPIKPKATERWWMRSDTAQRASTGPCGHFQHPVHQGLVTLVFELNLHRRQFRGV